MNQKLATLLREIHNEYLNLRNLDRLVDKTDFGALLDRATILGRENLLAALKVRDKDAIAKWLKQEESRDLEYMNVRQLRTLASTHKVYGYGGMVKSELISALRRIRK